MTYSCNVNVAGYVHKTPLGLLSARAGGNVSYIILSVTAGCHSSDLNFGLSSFSIF